MERQSKKGLSQRSAEKEKVSRDQKESQGASAKDYEHVYRLSVNNNVGREITRCHNCHKVCDGDKYRTKSGDKIPKVYCIKCVLDLQNYGYRRVRDSKKNEFSGSEIEQIRLAKKRFTEYLENKEPTVTTPLVGKIFKDILEQEIRDNREIVKILEDMEECLENEDN